MRIEQGGAFVDLDPVETETVITMIRRALTMRMITDKYLTGKLFRFVFAVDAEATKGAKRIGMDGQPI